MATLGLETAVIDRRVYANSVRRFREAGIVLPTFAELADPSRIPGEIRARLDAVDRDDLHPLNLFRVHWHNGLEEARLVAVPEHLVLPPALTGVEAPIVVLLGRPFPMIRAHKVLAAYGCLVPRLVTGQLDPTFHRAVWPSTGNYCRGGVAISRILGCRGVAVLPAGMSRERFEWLQARVVDPAQDIVRTPGTESNVKEIYDECARLAADPQNVVFNQFAELGNHLVHRLVTGRAAATVFEHLQRGRPALRLRAFVAATGSAGTLGAGDALKDRFASSIGAVEALECPTLLYNGYGEHNIQGIGDKHVPLIHNVTNTDFVTAVSDAATDSLLLVFGTEAGRRYLVERRRVPASLVASLDLLGLSSICNVLAAVKAAKRFGWGADDAVVTVATDAAEMYRTEHEKIRARRFPGGFDDTAAAEAFARHLLGIGSDHFRELDRAERDRIFNLGYFTWVEQQGVPLADFERRREQSFWRGLVGLPAEWDELIRRFNHDVAAA